MPAFRNKSCGVLIELVESKFYVVDRFSGPCAGPFDTVAQAEEERVGTNIEEDCYVGESQLINGKWTIGADRVAGE